MTIVKKFLDFNEKLLKKHDSKRYSSLLNKKPFEEVEDDLKFSSIHELIEVGYLEFLSLDIGQTHSTKYTIHLSDKAIHEIKKINLHDIFVPVYLR